MAGFYQNPRAGSARCMNCAVSGMLRSEMMQVIRTTVRNGRIVVVLNDDGMSEDERQRLHASIARGIRDGRAGREMDLDSFMDQLDAEP